MPSTATSAGLPIVDRLAHDTAPSGVAYFIVRDPNPDGGVTHSRQNYRKVYPNRNVPGWRRNGRTGSVSYPGPGALSEPGSKAMHTAIQKIRRSAPATLTRCRARAAGPA